MTAFTGTSGRLRRLAALAGAGLAASLLFGTAGLGQSPQPASTINPYLVLDHTRDELVRAHPELSSRDLDLLVFRIADIKSMPDRVAGPAGDWLCQADNGEVVRLAMRTSSYFTSRAGQTMSGEYRYARSEVVIASGPLRGMGISKGTFAGEQSPRQLDFHATEAYALRCREVL